MEYKVTIYFTSATYREYEINYEALQDLCKSLDDNQTRFIMFREKDKQAYMINVNNITSIHFEEVKDKDVE